MRLHSTFCSRELTKRVRTKNALVHADGALEWEREVVHECPCGGIDAANPDPAHEAPMNVSPQCR